MAKLIEDPKVAALVERERARAVKEERARIKAGLKDYAASVEVEGDEPSVRKLKRTVARGAIATLKEAA